MLDREESASLAHDAGRGDGIYIFATMPRRFAPGKTRSLHWSFCFGWHLAAQGRRAGRNGPGRSRWFFIHRNDLCFQKKL